MTLNREQAKNLFVKAVKLSRELDGLDDESSEEVGPIKHHAKGLIFRLARVIEDLEPGNDKHKDPTTEENLNSAAKVLEYAIDMARQRDESVTGMDIVERVMKKLADDIK